MRILITNDDGIHAPGLKTLHAIATDLAGPDGEVWAKCPWCVPRDEAVAAMQLDTQGPWQLGRHTDSTP